MNWPKLDTLPEGWKLDKTCGSPCHGYEFATNGKSVLNGQQRALVRVNIEPSRTAQAAHEPPKPAAPRPARTDKPEAQDPEVPAALNKLARAKMMERLLRDVRVDIQVCELEGWDVTEYLNDIRQLLNQLGEGRQGRLL